MRANKLANKIANKVAVGKNKNTVVEEKESFVEKVFKPKSKTQERRIKLSKGTKKKDKKNADS